MHSSRVLCWGVSVGGSLFRDLCRGGSLFGGVSVLGVSVPGESLSQAVSVQGGLCLGGGSLSGGVIVLGVTVRGSLSQRGLCPRGSLSRGVSVWEGVSVRRGHCPWGHCQGVSVPGGLCPGGSLSGRGVSVRRGHCPGVLCLGGLPDRDPSSLL